MKLMPEVGLNTPVSKTAGESGAHKIPYEHPADPDKLILKAKREGWQQEQDFIRPDLMPEQQHSYTMLMFYTRRLAHVLFPDNFPAVYGANATTMVVEKVGGRSLDKEKPFSLTQELSREEEPEFKPIREALGLHQDNIDNYSGNFIRSDEGFITYIDDLFKPGNNYFTLLFYSQCSLSELTEMFNKSFIARFQMKHILISLRNPRSMGITSDGRLELFEPVQLTQTIDQRPPTERSRALAIWARIQRHQANFAPIDIEDLKKRLKSVINQTAV